jgi:Tol biopolymer transport system component
VFASDRAGEYGLFLQRVDGGSAELLAKTEPGIRPQPETWSRDGKTLIFTNRAPLAGPATRGISMLTLAPKPVVQPVIKSAATNGSLSPDARWLAYVATGTAGRSEIYVEPFPPTGEKHQISRDGGTNPLWSPNGKELLPPQQNLWVDCGSGNAPRVW